MVWILGILMVAIVAALVFGLTNTPRKKSAEELRRRYALDPKEAVAIPLAEEREGGGARPGAGASNGTLALERGESAPLHGTSNWLRDMIADEPPPPPPPVTGRMVQTPDGEAIITTPPFALRPQMLSNRLGRFVNGLSKRLPAWMLVCPRVRLETLVIPTPPDGRDAEDWGQWRRRVRLRAVDVVICDRRTWKPVLAVMLKPAGKTSRREGAGGTASALTLAGGQDRMIDEVLSQVGLTLIHASGRLAEDWPLIEPYIQQAILHPADEEQIMLATGDSRPDPEAAVKLLKMDADGGWLLE